MRPEPEDERAPDATTMDRLLEEGEALLESARDTLAEVDVALNTAVVVIPPGALDRDPTDSAPAR